MDRVLLIGITHDGLKQELRKDEEIGFYLNKILKEYKKTYAAYEMSSEEGTLTFAFSGKELKLTSGDISLVPTSEYEVCGHCKIVKPFGEFTVMNSVDKVIQVPTLVKRIGHSHSHILTCNHCSRYFIAETDTILTDEEAAECNKLWEEKGEH